MSQPTEKQINKLFADMRSLENTILFMKDNIKRIDEVLTALTFEEYKFKCVFCGVHYNNETALDAHLRARGLH